MARYDLEAVNLDVAGMRFAIVAARFNRDLVGRLLDAALEAFAAEGVRGDDVVVVEVPGAFEIPLAAKQLAAGGRYDAVACLGAVVRGETPHFDYVASACAEGIMQASLDTGVPIIFGVLTVDDRRQGEARVGGEHGNKGTEAARAAMEMATLRSQLWGS